VVSGVNKNDDPNIFNSLISDLKRPLVLIARQAELGKTDTDKQHIESIQETAEKTLKLIDSYLLMSQSEYGQQLLPVSSFAVGSVIYNVAEELRPIAKKANIDVVLNVNDAIVAANPEGLKAAIWCISDMVIASTLTEQYKGVVEINTKKSLDDIKVSVLSKSMKVKNSDLDRAQRNLGKTHMALSSSSSDSGVRLAIASLLGESLGTKLTVVKGKYSQGIGFNLALSRQLQLV
jgi:K+-sensing histidine kinase KdpD